MWLKKAGGDEVYDPETKQCTCGHVLNKHHTATGDRMECGYCSCLNFDPKPLFVPEKEAADNGPTDEECQEKAWSMFKQHWNGLSSEQMDQVYEALGHKQADMSEEASDPSTLEFNLKRAYEALKGCRYSASVMEGAGAELPNGVTFQEVGRLLEDIVPKLEGLVDRLAGEELK